MLKIAPWFTGFSIILIHLGKNCIPILGQCHVKKEQLYADCYKRKLTKLPDNLGQEIEIMNISLNSFDKLTEKDFVSYTNLKELIMVDLHPLYVSINLFVPLENLAILDFSYSFLGSPPVKLPSSIKQLIADGLDPVTDISYFDLAGLNNLENISVREGHLQDFPDVPNTAPLVYVDLSLNPLNTLTYSDLAPYCLLRNIGLEGDLVIPIEECCGIKKWTEKYNISTSLECAESCAKTVKFSAEAIQSYEQCLGVGTETDSYLLYIEIAVVVIIIICLCFAAFKYFIFGGKKSRKNDAKYEDVEEEAIAEEL